MKHFYLLLVAMLGVFIGCDSDQMEAEPRNTKRTKASGDTAMIKVKELYNGMPTSN